MKRMVLILLTAALLCACATPAEPVVETDTRAEQTPAPIEEDVIGKVETEAPEKTLAQRIVEAWEAGGLLEGMAPYSEADLLDLYGIDLSACISGAGYSDAVSYVKETVVVEADEAAASEIEALLHNHIEQMKESFRSYDAEAYAIAEKAVLVRKDGVVLMIISPDAEAMKAVFEAQLP